MKISEKRFTAAISIMIHVARIGKVKTIQEGGDPKETQLICSVVEKTIALIFATCMHSEGKNVAAALNELNLPSYVTNELQEKYTSLVSLLDELEKEDA